MTAHSALTRELIDAGLKPPGKWPWRDHLTPSEQRQLAAIDAAKAAWEAVAGQRVMIVNRAIQRAKYAASKRGQAA